jgi:hypothetical protein
LSLPTIRASRGRVRFRAQTRKSKVPHGRLDGALKFVNSFGPSTGSNQWRFFARTINLWLIYISGHFKRTPSTGGKRGFHSTHLSRTKFDPRPKGSSVPVHLKMWAREH